MRAAKRPAQNRARQRYRLSGTCSKTPSLRHPFPWGWNVTLYRSTADSRSRVRHPRSLRADAGIVITASHNAYDDNGIKFFRADGYSSMTKIEYQIESLVFSAIIENIRPTADEVGRLSALMMRSAAILSRPRLPSRAA